MMTCEIASPEPALSDKKRLLRIRLAMTSEGARNDNIIARALILTFVLILLSSCAQIEKAKETATIKDVVMSYNKGLINAAKTGDVMPLKNIASEDVLKKLYFWIAAWGDSDLYMDAELKNIEFKNVNISGGEAKVLTSERWTYVYKSIKNKQVIIPKTYISYEMEYILHKKSKDVQKKWIITEIKILSEKQGQGKGK